jgi:hypothetical protein
MLLKNISPVVVLLVTMYLPQVAIAARESAVKNWPDESLTVTEKQKISKVYSHFEALPGPKSKFPDGVHGYNLISSKPNYGIYSGLNDKQQRLEHVARAVCNLDLLAVVRGISAKSFESDNSTMVYTKYRLKIENNIFQKDKGGDEAKKIINLVQIGGEVGDGADAFRVAHNLMLPLAHGKNYLVVGVKPEDDDEIYITATQTIEVVDGLIYPIAGKWMGYDVGTPVALIAADFAEVQKNKTTPCQ